MKDRKTLCVRLPVLCVFFMLAGALYSQSEWRDGKRLQTLVSEADLNCCFFIHEGEDPAIQIVGADKQKEKTFFSDWDVVYLNGGELQGIETGQEYSVIEVGTSLKDFGRLSYRRGRVKILSAAENKSVAELLRTCEPIMIGHYIVPVMRGEKEGVEKKKIEQAVFDDRRVTGQCVYFQHDIKQIATGQWALIDRGTEHGLHNNRQLFVFRRQNEGVSPKIFATAVVIDSQSRTATIKILDCLDAVVIGDLVQPFPD